MSNWNIYAGSKEEKQQADSNLSQISTLLDLATYKGASSSAFVRWLGRQDPTTVAKALRSLRQSELKNQITAMKGGK